MTTAPLHKIRRRSAAELATLAAALAIRPAVLVVVRVVSFRTIRRVERIAGRAWFRRPTPNHARERMVAWAVATAAVLLPAKNSCLADALVAHWLLAALGCPSTVRFSVATTPTLRAHAWVEAAGGIVVGAAGADAFTILE